MTYRNIIEELETKIDYVKEYLTILEAESKKEVNLENPEEAVYSKVDLILYQTEYSYLLNELIFEIKLVLKYAGEEVTDKVKEFFAELKPMYTRKFIIKEGKIEETEVGYLKENRERYLNSPQFKQLQEFLELSDSSQN